VLPGSLQDLEMLIWIIRPELVHHPCYQILLFCKVLQAGPANLQIHQSLSFADWHHEGES